VPADRQARKHPAPTDDDDAHAKAEALRQCPPPPRRAHAPAHLAQGLMALRLDSRATRSAVFVTTWASPRIGDVIRKCLAATCPPSPSTMQAREDLRRPSLCSSMYEGTAKATLCRNA
jgi:hypothetical protein